jgi:hypothetical protein
MAKIIKTGRLDSLDVDLSHIFPIFSYSSEFFDEKSQDPPDPIATTAGTTRNSLSKGAKRFASRPSTSVEPRNRS